MRPTRLAAILLPLAFLVAADQTSVAQIQSLRLAPQIVSFTLQNGLQVLVIPDKRLSVVTHMVWYRTGSADEPKGKSGIAHFLEHLMFKGTERFPAGHFSRFVATIGGQENAFTSWDYTAFFQRTEKAQLPRLMDFEADRMANLRITDEVVTPEREVILEERRQVIDNIPSSQFSEQMNASLYQNHPYRIPIIGWEREMRGLTRQDALDYYDHHYSPNNAVLVIAGDVTPEEVRKLAEDTYGKVPVRVPSDQLVRVRPGEPPERAAHRIVMTDPRVRTSTWTRDYLTPSYGSIKDGTAEALDVLGEILGGETGRVYRTLVEGKGLASNAGAAYGGSGLEFGRFVLTATPRQGTSFTDVEAAMDQIVADLLDKGVTQEEVDRAKSSMVDQVLLAQDNLATVAQIFGSGLMEGQTVEELQTWPERVSKITVDDVNRAARAWLDIRRSVTGTLAPAQLRPGEQPAETAAPIAAPTMIR